MIMNVCGCCLNRNVPLEVSRTNIILQIPIIQYATVIGSVLFLDTIYDRNMLYGKIVVAEFIFLKHAIQFRFLEDKLCNI